MTIELQASSKSPETPVSQEFLQGLISENAGLLQNSKEFILAIAEKIGVKSSKHKFLVLVTTVKHQAPVDADLSISSTVGAVWDAQKDGYFSFKVSGDELYLVTVYWIYVE